MDDAGAGRHPLDVPGAERAAVPGRVLVLHLAREQVRHRLEAAVRVVRRAERLAGRVIGRPHLIEEKERIDEVERGPRKGAADDEAAPFALAVRGDDAEDFSEMTHDFGEGPRGSWIRGALRSTRVDAIQSSWRRLGVGVGVAVGVRVGLGVDVAVGAGVGVRVGVAVAAGVGVRVGLAVGPGVGVLVATGVGVGVGPGALPTVTVTVPRFESDEPSTPHK